MDGSGQSDPRQEFPSRADEKVQILEDAKCPEIRHETNEQEAATSGVGGGVFNLQSDEVVHAGGAQKNKGEPPTGRQRGPLPRHQVREKGNWIAYKKAGIKNVTAGEKERFSGGVGPERPGDTKDDREEKEKASLDEEHGGFFPDGLTNW